MPELPSIIITDDMLQEALLLESVTRVNRTVASKIDTVTGNIGEFVFAQYFFGNWKLHRVGKNKGATDFEDIEIKTSSFPFSYSLNLLVREDYARKRKPLCYVQIILDVHSRNAEKISAGTKAIICGFATLEASWAAAEIINATLFRLRTCGP
jgi:hypothetical protein